MAEKIQFAPLIIGTMRLGAWGAQLDTKTLERFIDACVDMGMLDFDHADIYGCYSSEAEFGAVLKRRPDLRQRIQNTTKCGIKLKCNTRPEHRIKSYDSTKKHILWSAEQSLEQLGVDCLDLLLLHRPDVLMDPEEIAEAFSQLKKAGKVKHFGVSNFTPSQVDMLHHFTPLVNHQVEASILHTAPFEDGTFDQCMRLGLAVTAWSPLCGGRIFQESEDKQVLDIQRVIANLSEKYNASADQILLAFLRKHPVGIRPILGTSKIERVATAVSGLAISLTHEEWYMLWEAMRGKEVA